MRKPSKIWSNSRFFPSGSFPAPTSFMLIGKISLFRCPSSLTTVLVPAGDDWKLAWVRRGLGDALVRQDGWHVRLVSHLCEWTTCKLSLILNVNGIRSSSDQDW